MIDTIRFKIPVDEITYRRIIRCCHQRSETNNETGTSAINFYSKDLKLGSFDYHQSIFIYDKNCIYIEFSAPKIVYGQNVFLLYPSQLDAVVIRVKENIERELRVKLIDYHSWVIQRLDLCYAWKFNTQYEAYIALRTLDNYDYSRKKKTIRDTSIEYIGSAYKVKFYLKKDEFLVHDFKRLDKLDTDYAHELINLTKGLLRYEVSLKKEVLTYPSNFKLRIKDVTEEFCLERLNTYLSKLIGNNNRKTLDYFNITQLLFRAYSKQKATNLLEFYNLYFCPDKKQRDVNRKFILKQSNRSTIYRKKKALRDVGIGIKKLEKKGIDFDLCIPSEKVINNEIIAILEMFKAIFQVGFYKTNTLVNGTPAVSGASRGSSVANLDAQPPKRLSEEGVHEVSPPLKRNSP